MQKLAICLNPSNSLLLFFLLIYIASAGIIFWLSPSILLSLVASGILGFLAYRDIWNYALLRDAKAIIYFEYHVLQQWRLQKKSGQQVVASLAGDSVVTPYISLLLFYDANGYAYRVILLWDNASLPARKRLVNQVFWS